MKTKLFIDTETTGFKKSGALIQEGQGRVCQMALILTDENQRILSEFSTLIKPDGWTIGEGAYNVHGISDEDCEKYGVTAEVAVAMFKFFMERADEMVAHNEEFDRGMMDIEFAYAGHNVPPMAPWFCTMKRNTHISGGRWPKLEATLRHYCNRSMGDSAHDAMVDTKACRDIYFAMHGVQQNV